MLLKRLLLIFILFSSLVIVSGCNITKNTSNLTTTENQTTTANQTTTDSTEAPYIMSYDEFKGIYDKSYFDLLPTSLYNQDMVNHYKELDLTEFDFEEGFLDITSGEDFIPFPPINTIDKTEFVPNDLENLNLYNTFILSGNISQGPIDFVYSNIGSMQYLLDLVELMNNELENYGSIKFDNTTITVPGSEFGNIPDPFNSEQNLTLNDVTATFMTEDNKGIIVVSTENNYTYTEGDTSVTGEMGIYLIVSVYIDEDNKYTVELSLYITLDLDMNDNVENSGAISCEIGYYMKAIENEKLIINNMIEADVNLNVIEIPNINETFTYNGSFVLEKGDNTTTVDYKVATNAIEVGEIRYHVEGNDNMSYIYIGGEASDEDFYGENIPAQQFDSIFVYNSSNELIFVGGIVDFNIPKYDEYGNYTTDENFNYSAYAWNLKDVNGWDKIIETEYSSDFYFEIFSGETLIFSAESQLGEFDGNDVFVEGETVLATALSSELGESSICIYVHAKNGNIIPLELPTGLSSDNHNYINNLFSNLDSLKDEINIDFSNNLYKVPENIYNQ